MKILHIIAGMPPESGIAAVVTRLAVEQRLLGHQVAVACTRKKCLVASLPLRFRHSSNGFRSAPTSPYCLVEKQVRVVTFRLSRPHATYFSWGMLLGLGKEIKDADVVHVHSNWTFPVWWGAWLALRHKKTLVMSPHGSYNPLQLKHSVWKKNLVGWLDQWVLRRASVIHVTCEAEKRWALAFLQGRSEKLKVQRVRTKIVVIPNGVC